MAKGYDTGSRKNHHGKHFNHIGDHSRVLKWCGWVCPEETSAVCSQMLDGFKSRYRSHCQVLMFSFNRFYCKVLHQCLRCSLTYQDQTYYKRYRDQDPGCDPYHISVKIPQLSSGKSSAECHAGRITAGCWSEHHKNDDTHLRCIGKSAFTGIMLQVGVCHKTDDRIKGKTWLHSFNAIWIQKQKILNSEDQVSHKNHHSICSYQSKGIFFPSHILIFDTADFIYQMIDWIKNFICKSFLFCGNVIHVLSHGNHKYQENCQRKNDL